MADALQQPRHTSLQPHYSSDVVSSNMPSSPWRLNHGERAPESLQIMYDDSPTQSDHNIIDEQDDEETGPEESSPDVEDPEEADPPVEGPEESGPDVEGLSVPDESDTEESGQDAENASDPDESGPDVDDPDVKVDFDPFQLGEQVQSQISDGKLADGSDIDLVFSPVRHEQTQQLNPLGTTTRLEHAEMYRQERAKGIRPVLDLVYREELACKTLQSADPKQTLDDAYLAYVTFYPEVITGLIDGDLAAKMMDPSSPESEIHQHLRARAVECKWHPEFYMNSILDDQGRSPTARVVHGAIMHLKHYCSGKDIWLKLSNEIDNAADDDEAEVSEQHTREGFRKYLWNCTYKQYVERSKNCHVVEERKGENTDIYRQAATQAVFPNDQR